LASSISGTRDLAPSHTSRLVQSSRSDSAFYSSAVRGCPAKNTLRCWCSGAPLGRTAAGAEQIQRPRAGLGSVHVAEVRQTCQAVSMQRMIMTRLHGRTCTLTPPASH